MKKPSSLEGETSSRWQEQALTEPSLTTLIPYYPNHAAKVLVPQHLKLFDWLLCCYIFKVLLQTSETFSGSAVLFLCGLICC